MTVTQDLDQESRVYSLPIISFSLFCCFGDFEELLSPFFPKADRGSERISALENVCVSTLP